MGFTNILIAGGRHLRPEGVTISYNGVETLFNISKKVSEEAGLEIGGVVGFALGDGEDKGWIALFTGVGNGWRMQSNHNGTAGHIRVRAQQSLWPEYPPFVSFQCEYMTWRENGEVKGLKIKLPLADQVKPKVKRIKNNTVAPVTEQPVLSYKAPVNIKHRPELPTSAKRAEELNKQEEFLKNKGATPRHAVRGEPWSSMSADEVEKFCQSVVKGEGTYGLAKIAGCQPGSIKYLIDKFEKIIDEIRAEKRAGRSQ